MKRIAQFSSRRSARIPGFDIVRAKIHEAHVQPSGYQLEIVLLDPATGRQDRSYGCAGETSSGVVVFDSTNAYYTARPGSSASPINF